MFSRRGAENTLGLAGDGDDVDLRAAIEACFGIALTEAEFAQSATLGQLHTVLCAKLGKGACLTARAFRRLRDGLGRPDLAPATPIAALRGDASDAAWCREAGARSGLDLDCTEWPVWAGWLGLALVAGPPLAALYAWPAQGAGALLWLVLWGLVGLLRWVPRRLPAGVATVGDLLRRAMGRNHARLAAAGPGNSADVWLALCGVVRELTGHQGPITPGTTFHPSPWRR